MTVVPHPDEPHALIVLPPDEAFRRAMPPPRPEDLVIEGLTDEEWDAFEQALRER